MLREHCCFVCDRHNSAVYKHTQCVNTEQLSACSLSAHKAITAIQILYLILKYCETFISIAPPFSGQSATHPDEINVQNPGPESQQSLRYNEQLYISKSI
jgi:hypothetical protein